MAVLAQLSVADPPALWSELGFAVDDDQCRVGGIDICLGTPGRGITGWGLAALDSTGGLEATEGLSTRLVEARPGGSSFAHPNAVVSVDHVVLATPDVERTVSSLAELGVLERRRRDGSRPGHPSVQVFYRLGEAILELVGHPEEHGSGPARFWGVTFTVADLEATAASLGDRLRPARAAVQPGRLIATLDHSAGSSVEMAFMTPGS